MIEVINPGHSQALPLETKGHEGQDPVEDHPRPTDNGVGVRDVLPDERADDVTEEDSAHSRDAGYQLERHRYSLCLIGNYNILISFSVTC